ncbi:MAG: SUMF1/EgtB/PvdO family nonheme iron enzyme [Gammaproteobacteria bacterium]|nr:SUMF1/EgtB/PvdO family nonheme iron enzyme [Gammaproteobacteria bacterium]
MNRYIDIVDKKNNSSQFNSTDLPLVVVISVVEDISIIKVTNESNNKDEAIAYISDDDGYLFLQPANENSKNQLFHNDEIINQSVWLKSGDKIQMEHHCILYQVSGDKIQFKITEKNNFELKETPVLLPPTYPINDEKKDIFIKETNNFHYQRNEKNYSKLKKIIVYVILITLIISSIFILLAETVTIKTNPDYESLSINGGWPTFQIGKHFILIGGEYQVNIEKKGYKNIHKNLKIDSKNNSFNFILDEMPGRIQFDLTPKKNNQVFINGKLINKEAEDWYEIDSGEHELTIKNSRYKSFKKMLLIEGKNKAQIYEVTLEPNWGFLNINDKINSDLSDLDIQVISDSDKLKSLSYKKNLELVSGDYTIKINKDKYQEIIKQITIRSDETIDFEIPEFLPKDGTISINSIPSGSHILIDGKFYGKTPQEIKIQSGIDHKIQLSLSGYKKITKKIKINPEQEIKKEFKFESIRSSVFVSVIPETAQLFINGKKQNKSSGKYNISGNNNLFLVKAKGYQSQSKKITSESFSKNLSFHLIREVAKNKRSKAPILLNKKKSNYNNSIGQKMILVKPASFVIGSKKNEVGRGSNENPHDVRINYSYYLSATEVSNKQFREYKASHDSGVSFGQTLDSSGQPVVNVSWNEAALFANWLSQKEGYKKYYVKVGNKMIPSKQTDSLYGYRLPYESEWLLAAKGKQQNKYPWSGVFPPKNKVGNFADESAKSYIANVIENYNDKNIVSSKIGTYGKNLMGFYDLGGNVSEWCQDYYSPDYGISLIGTSKKIISDPKGPSKGTHRVVKDSSWRDASMTELRLNYRSYSKKKAKDIGFRLARMAK